MTNKTPLELEVEEEIGENILSLAEGRAFFQRHDA